MSKYAQLWIENGQQKKREATVAESHAQRKVSAESFDDFMTFAGDIMHGATITELDPNRVGGNVKLALSTGAVIRINDDGTWVMEKGSEEASWISPKEEPKG